jgi:hypothetical protein
MQHKLSFIVYANFVLFVLQRVPHEFATFLNESDVDFIYLCADNGYRFPIDIKHPNTVSRMKFTNWDLVCEYLKLKADDVIRFKFEADLAYVSKRCHIMKLN